MTTATITYRLSTSGQKTSLLSGGDGKQSQKITVPQTDPEFAEVVKYGSVGSDGSVDLYVYHEFDSPQTAAQVVQYVADAAKAESEKAAAEKARLRDETIAVLRERRTTETTEYANGVRYLKLKPDWPWNAPTEVRESPEALAWIAELKSANSAAEQAAQTESARLRAEREKIAAEEAAAEQARREELSLEENDEDFSVADGALTQVPIYEGHKRGKNWLALISADPSAPGGLARRFAPKARGESYYLLPDWKPGDAIEFGADYYSGGGRKSSHRWYGFFVRTVNGAVVLRKCATAKQALKQGAEYAKEHGEQPGEQPIEDQVAAGIARINSEGGIEPSRN